MQRMTQDLGTIAVTKDAGPQATPPAWRRALLAGSIVSALVLAAFFAAPAFLQPHQHGNALTHDGDQWIAPGVMMVGRPTTITTKPVSSDALSHVPGKSVTVEIVEFQPGAHAPEHHHAGSVTVYVLAGTVRSQLQGAPAMLYHAGQSFFEPPGAIHLFAENPSATEVARIMAIHVADDGAQLTTFH